jgi:hypothetical protein
MALATTDQEYYENPEFWGEDQFITLKDVIDNIMLLADDDSYFKHTKRFRASIIGKMGIKELNLDVTPSNKAISIQLAPHKTFPFPRYMTNWYRVSVVNECGKLHVLDVNNGVSIIQDYLQDHEYELLYDNNGEILRGADFNADIGDCCLTIECPETTANTPCSEEMFKDSWVTENRAGSYFEFSEDLVDEIIVIEFQTAGLDSLDDCDIKVHQAIEQTITRWTQWNLLMGKRNIPDSTALLYYNLYKKALKKSERLLAPKITIQQMLKSMSLRYS